MIGQPCARGEYRVFYFRGRPILAVPARPRHLKLGGLRRYYPVTKKRAMMQLFLRFLMLARIDFLFSRRQQSPLPAGDDFGFRDWLGEIRGALKQPAEVAAVVWSPRPHQSRLYVHLVGQTGKPVAFFKISLAKDTNVFRTEIDASIGLDQLKLRHTNVPRVLDHGVYRDHCYVGYEPFPVNSRPFNGPWSELAASVEEYSGVVRRIGADELDRLEWWNRFKRNEDYGNAEFKHQLKQAVERGIRVCRVHGDVQPINISKADGRIWIFDWEFGSAAAPYRTDALSYRLSINQHKWRSDPKAAIKDLLADFVTTSCDAAADDLVMALAYLWDNDFPLVRTLAANWRFIRHIPESSFP